MKISKIQIIVVVLLIGFVGHYFVTLKEHTSSDAASQKTETHNHYFCPMHPGVTSDHPGTCPICGMNLEEGNSQKREDSKPSEHKIIFYKHPMGKNVTSKVPMKDEMGMDFIPVYEDEVSGENADKTVDGRTSFLLSDAGQQMIGVTKAPAKRMPFVREIKTSGRVAYDPELYTAISEYRVALSTAHSMHEGYLSEVSAGSSSLVEASKLKLKLMGISDTQIKALSSLQSDSKELLLPNGKVWVYANIFEYELPDIQIGQEVTVQTPFVQTQILTGKISSITPTVNQMTRASTVRVEIRDPNNVLKPDMYLTVLIHVDLGEQLTVPESAVIHTGKKDLVFVVDEEGKFSPKEVITGSRNEGSRIISSGLHDNDMVVTSANFLIDSESRLQAVVQEASKANQKQEE